MENHKQVFAIKEVEDKNQENSIEQAMEEISLRPETPEGAEIKGVANLAEEILAANNSKSKYENPAMLIITTECQVTPKRGATGEVIEVSSTKSDTYHRSVFNNPEFRAKLERIHMKSGEGNDDGDSNKENVEIEENVDVHVSVQSTSSAATVNTSDNNKHDCLSTSMYCCFDIFDCVIM